MDSGFVWRKQVGEGERRFIGFDESYAHPPEDFAGRIRPGLPEFWSVMNATLVPLSQPDKFFFAGGVFGETGYLPRHALHRVYGAQRFAKVVEPHAFVPSPSARHIDRAWFGGYFIAHHGHFVLESMARLLSEEIAASDLPIVFLSFGQHRRVYLPMARVLNVIGIDPSRIVLVNEVLSVGELLGQDPAYEFLGMVHPQAYRRIQTPKRPGQAGKVVYLSRTKLDYRIAANKRWAMGEDVFQARLRERFGAEIVHPQDLLFAEQIDKFAEAETVIGCEGSAFFTAMFLRKAPHMIKLCGARPPIDLLLTDEVSEGTTTYLYASSDPFTPAIVRHAPWRLDIERTLATIADLVAS